MVALAGISLTLLALRDVWQTLFVARARGNLNQVLTRVIWRLFGVMSGRRPAWLAIAGPTAFLVVIASWVILIATGFALVYWSFMPAAFTVNEPDDAPDLLLAMYVSMVTLATLGYGDVVPDAEWAKVVAPLEAIVGFFLLTAAISWLTSISAALSRRRALAHEVAALRSALDVSRVGRDVSQLSIPLTSYVASLGAIAADAEQTPTTYYWPGTTQEREAFADALELLHRIASHIANESTISRSERLQAVMVIEGLNEYALLLERDFLRRKGPTYFEQTIEALRTAYAIPVTTSV